MQDIAAIAQCQKKSPKSLWNLSLIDKRDTPKQERKKRTKQEIDNIAYKVAKTLSMPQIAGFCSQNPINYRAFLQKMTYQDKASINLRHRENRRVPKEIPWISLKSFASLLYVSVLCSLVARLT